MKPTKEHLTEIFNADNVHAGFYFHVEDNGGDSYSIKFGGTNLIEAFKMLVVNCEKEEQYKPVIIPLISAGLSVVGMLPHETRLKLLASYIEMQNNDPSVDGMITPEDIENEINEREEI